MSNQTEKQQRPWARKYLLGVRIAALAVLGGAGYLMIRGDFIAAVILGVSSPILETGLYRCPYCKTRLNTKQKKLPPHCLCPGCHREL